MDTKKDKTYKYTTEEEAKEINKEKTRQRYYENKEEIRRKQKEYYRKQREMAEKYKQIQNQQLVSTIQTTNEKNNFYQYQLETDNIHKQMHNLLNIYSPPVLQIVGTENINIDTTQIEQILNSGSIVRPMTSTN